MGMWGGSVARKTKDSPENPQLLERGQKQRAGFLISSYLRAIAQEVTEVVPDDSFKPGPPRLVSKAESLARWLWQAALPRKEEDGTTTPPNLDVAKLVLDRIDGKPSVGGEDPTDGRETVPDKISRMNAERVNKIAEEVAVSE